jgi:hypothetical protein
MTDQVYSLLPSDELAVLKCFLEGSKEPDHFRHFYETIGVPTETSAPMLNIAVAHILLHEIQGGLPQWLGTSFGRKPIHRHKAAKLAFNPKLICCINWADSGPGFSWPESYHLTYIPGFDKFVITSSRDSEDAWGCTDHAIYVADGRLKPIEAAKKGVTHFWNYQAEEWGQERWAYLFDEGLIDGDTVICWADQVWPSEQNDD